MATDDEINSALVGDSGARISRHTVVALKSLMSWPVEAFFVDLVDKEHQVVGWVNRDSIGVAVVEGSGEDAAVRANIYPIRQIESLRVDVAVVDDENAPRLNAVRTLTVEFLGGRDRLTVDVGNQPNKHSIDSANKFVSRVLEKVGGPTQS